MRSPSLAGVASDWTCSVVRVKVMTSEDGLGVGVFWYQVDEGEV